MGIWAEGGGIIQEGGAGGIGSDTNGGRPARDVEAKPRPREMFSAGAAYMRGRAKFILTSGTGVITFRRVIQDRLHSVNACGCYFAAHHTQPSSSPKRQQASPSLP